jgi:hypothetical protein
MPHNISLDTDDFFILVHTSSLPTTIAIAIVFARDNTIHYHIRQLARQIAGIGFFQGCIR